MAASGVTKIGRDPLGQARKERVAPLAGHEVATGDRRTRVLVESAEIAQPRGKVKCRARPAHVLQQKRIDAFHRLLREKHLESGAFAKELLRLRVNEIRMNKRRTQFTGSSAALAQAATGNLGNSMRVPRSAPKRARRTGQR